MQIHFTLTADEVANFYQYIYWENAEHRKDRRNSYIMFVSLLVVFIILFFAVRIGWVMLLSAFGITIFGSYVLGLSKLFKRAYRRVGHDRYQSLKSEQRISINESGIFISDPQIKNEIQWAVVKKIEVVDTMVLLYVYDNACLIPKKCFKDEAEITEFLSLVNTYKQG